MISRERHFHFALKVSRHYNDLLSIHERFIATTVCIHWQEKKVRIVLHDMKDVLHVLLCTSIMMLKLREKQTTHHDHDQHNYKQ